MINPENDKSIQYLCENNLFAIYFGVTKLRLKDEDCRWASARGLPQGGRNKPIIQKENGTIFNRDELFSMLGAQSRFIFASKLRPICRRVEDLLQLAIYNKDLGIRLHRFVSMGSFQQENETIEQDYLCKVFVTFFPITKIPWFDETKNEFFMELNKVIVKVVKHC